MLADVGSGASGLVVALIVAYLLGAIPVANLVAARRGVDLRERGDRNPGYWNARGVLGERAALAVLAGDAAKGALAVAVARGLGLEWWGWYAACLAAMVGHAAPVFAGFRGGRSVLAWIGGTLVASPAAGAVAVAWCLLYWAATRRFALAVRLGVVAFPLCQLVADGPERTAATGVLMTAIGIRFAAAWRAARRTPAPASGAVADPGPR
ncbi:MAG: glycerol-3-phosphate acyltransferase [Ilumatobacteraceae bacterium]|jgi:glycerol-3-phosphate acyltransferase PlsY